MYKETKRECLAKLKSQLENERSSFIPQWQEIGDYILPRRIRLNKEQSNRGDRRNQKIIDSTASKAARSLRAGLMGGITSPARLWFRLSTPDNAKNELTPVKDWLQLVTDRMSSIFLRSNLYNQLPTIYGDVGCFGTAALYIEEDFEDVIRCYSYPLGSYTISNNDRMKVDTFFRDFQLTVRQLVEKFGVKNEKGEVANWENFSERVKTSWDRGEKETWVNITHAILPNEDYDPQKLDSKFKRYSSYYFEEGDTIPAVGDKTKELFLRESGYDHFPVLVPRWEVSGEDVYGTECPGMTALGDVKQLQLGERRVMQAIDKMVSPPMQGPNALKSQAVDLLPNGITYHDTREGQQGLRPVHEVNVRIQELEQKQAQVRQRIQQAFYEDLFLMISNLDRRQITATEIEERQQEKLLALGPVLEQLNQDLLDPLIDVTFDYMIHQDLVPPPPPDLAGSKLKVEYLSIMAAAQKAVNVGAIQRLTQFVGGLAQFDPSVLDKMDGDQLVDVFGETISVPAGIIRSDDQVKEIRDSRRQAQAQQARQQMIAQGAQTAKTLSQTNVGSEGENALDALIKQGQAGNLLQ